jgi:glycosyltransferase involved in cell wall biosynthesis
MDELSQFKNAPPALVANEQRLINAADIVFTGGYELWSKKSKQHGNVHFFGCGVEYDHFARAQKSDEPVPEELEGLEGPVIGWFGVVDERFDYELVEKAARLRPEWNFVMVGPVVKVDPANLPQAKNLLWLGGRDYQVLPSYCRGYDVCMMPFALNESTEFINPTKALEYLATGKPVVATPVRDVVRQYSDLVYLVSDADEFVKVVDQVLNAPDEGRARRGSELAKSRSWDSTVNQMQALIRKATSSEALAS